MKHEFVPYEPSLDMKELGFDEPCFGTYLSSFQSNWKVYELILEMGMNEEFEDNRNVYLLEGACSAPTFSQAFRWFRENHKLGAIVGQFGYGIEDEYGQIIYNIDDDEKPLCYEEAELACLIKLIEITNGSKRT